MIRGARWGIMEIIKYRIGVKEASAALESEEAVVFFFLDIFFFWEGGSAWTGWDGCGL